MGLYSRNRGKRGERLWCSFCREQGYDVHRTAQYRGNTGAAGDVEGLPFVHVEVKYVQHLNIRMAMEQSIHDAAAEEKGNLPIVAHKRTREEWLVTMTESGWKILSGAFDHQERIVTVFDRREKFNIQKAVTEARLLSDTKDIVSVKYSRGDVWGGIPLVTMRAEDWFELYREWEAGMDLKAREAHERHE